MAKSVRKKPKLTPKVERFCQLYVVYLNGARAARESGYSERSAKEQASMLLTNPNVQSRIVELQHTGVQQFNVMKQHLAGILMDIANAKIEDITDPDTGSILPVDQWPEHMKRVISGIESDELYAGSIPVGLKRKVKMSDRTKAVELLNKMFGFNMPDKVAQTNMDGTEDMIPVIKIYPVQAKKDD